ncbi:ABC transporter ATP-binding protein [Cryobacterium sp. SO2]|uniref:ABC transporter ATP-binding protein n=1 Tax=Cryobacterium sp. SO2 TaxID=1897060 RepID=UPI0023DAD48F|nr:ABC transporter ATP-binding protein [Cryobacterium sp. SO2]WEO76318.1 ABC transporter ATP-binding protein [Cryobacterium sp. SO2]
MSALVELNRVSVTYRSASRPALIDASLSIEPGEIVLVAGPSGCGKSTLLRVVNGLVPRSYRAEVSGSIQVNGQDSAEFTLRTISETVGTLLQNPAKQVVGHSVLAELAFGLENRGVRPAEILSRAHAVARRLGIENLLETAPHELSGGQLQLVAFAGILILEPALIIVDEPLANLDPDASHRLLGAVREYVRGGGAALIVEHRVDEIVELAPDRVLYLDEGATLYSGDLAGFLAVASPQAVKLPFRTLVDRHRSEPDGQPVLAEPDCATAGAARLEFVDAHLGYGSTTILSAVTTRLHAGERVAILGHNGAGKSTLLRAAVGLVDPLAGQVLLENVPVETLGAKELVGICGYLFQNPAQALFSDTVSAELAFGPKNLGRSEAEIAEISRIALEAVLLHEEPDILARPPRTLSFGQQRRLAVALALTLQPRTLILDEPTAGQDERSATHFLDAIWDLPGIDSIYFITHDIDMALSRADRVIVVSDGCIVADDTPAAIVHHTGLWHATTVGATAGVLRETDYVRAAREHGPRTGRMPRAWDLARQVAGAPPVPAPAS